MREALLQQAGEAGIAGPPPSNCRGTTARAEVKDGEQRTEGPLATNERNDTGTYHRTVPRCLLLEHAEHLGRVGGAGVLLSVGLELSAFVVHGKELTTLVVH